MYICIYIHICINTYKLTYICTRMYIYAHVFWYYYRVRMHVDVFIFIRILLYIGIHVCMRKCIYTPVDILYATHVCNT